MAPDGSGHLVATSQLPDNDVFPFLKLPAEIRMEIYLFIYLEDSTRRRAHYHYITSYRGRPTAEKVLGFGRSRQLLATLPSAILLTCNQIYYECREIPFHHNLFEFSSAASCSDFSRSKLQPWQVNAIRHATIKITSQQIKLRCTGELHGLCKVLAQGLRGLRLTIIHSGQPSYRSPRLDLYKALSLVQQFEYLELDLRHVKGGMPGDLQWSQGLEKILNDSKPDGSKHVQVVRLESKLYEP